MSTEGLFRRLPRLPACVAPAVSKLSARPGSWVPRLFLTSDSFEERSLPSLEKQGPRGTARHPCERRRRGRGADGCQAFRAFFISFPFGNGKGASFRARPSACRYTGRRPMPAREDGRSGWFPGAGRRRPAERRSRGEFSCGSSDDRACSAAGAGSRHSKTRRGRWRQGPASGAASSGSRAGCAFRACSRGSGSAARSSRATGIATTAPRAGDGRCRGRRPGGARPVGPLR